jgi:hypothetical protein
MAGLEAAGRHDICPVPHLKLEEAERPLQHEVGAVVQRLKRRLHRVPANQHEAGTKQLVRQLRWPRLAVVRSRARLPAGKYLLQVVQERRRRRLGLRQVLAREDRLRTEDCLGGGVGTVHAPCSADA